MNNRIVRWIVYLCIGVALGVGVSYYQKQQKMNEGIIELTPDEEYGESLEIPSRDDEVLEEQSFVEDIPEHMEETEEDELTGEATEAEDETLYEEEIEGIQETEDDAVAEEALETEDETAIEETLEEPEDQEIAEETEESYEEEDSMEETEEDTSVITPMPE